jgi:2-polyprenyl-3-methyl-5-hydroxy-6-metoxy-1,4-benzoquinol methylase
MRHVFCNCCGADDTVLAFTGRDLLHGVPGEFTLVQCTRCRLLYMNPQLTPSELEAYYPDDYEAHVGSQKQRLGWLHRLDYNYGIDKRYRAIMGYIETGRMLDVGCGTGAFLDGMRERGWEVQGIEPGPRAAAYASEELDLDVQNTTLEAAQLEPASLDLVTMWNVLEHLSDPLQGLRRIRSSLRPGGLLIVAIPNLDSYDQALFGNYWAGYDLPRHLFTFPAPTMERMAQEAGFKVADRRCIYGTYHAFVYSARFAMAFHLGSEPLRALLTKLLLSYPARLLMMPACRIVDLRNRGSIITWFLQRPEQA